MMPKKHDDIGVSPSGKATGFDPVMRRFESCHPSHLSPASSESNADTEKDAVVSKLIKDIKKKRDQTKKKTRKTKKKD